VNKACGRKGDTEIIGGIQRYQILVNNEEHDNLESGLHGLDLEINLAGNFEKVFKLGSGNINHIVAAMGAHDRIKQFHLALDLDEIDKGCAPRKGGAKRSFREICVDYEGVAVFQQQVIDQHARQQGFAVAVPVGTYDVNSRCFGQWSAVLFSSGRRAAVAADGLQ
jgi:hypothetical protein